MDARAVDPRSATWEERKPAYRVYFWERAAAASVAQPDDAAWTSDEWRLVGATNVRDALGWATGPVGRGRRYQLFVEAQSPTGDGLLLLIEGGPTAL